MRRNAKREATRGEAGEWEGPADELEWEGAGELAAQTTISRANGDFASEEGHSPPPPTPCQPKPVVSGYHGSRDGARIHYDGATSLAKEGAL